MTDIPATDALPSELQAMLDAHVAYEVARLTGPALDESVREEVAALFAWLREVRLRDVASPESVSGTVRRLAVEAPVTDAVRAHVSDTAAAVHAGLLAEDSPVDDVLGKADFDRIVGVAIGMDGVRREVMEQVTTSTVYSRLVAHVLYHGIKTFLLTENVVAKRIPGASSLVRLGQRGLDAAAPGLDNALVSFVNANIKDTVRDSQRYLDLLLDEPLMRTAAEEARAANAGRSVSSAAALVTEEQVREGAAVGLGVWLSLRGTPLFARMVAYVVDDVFTRFGDRPVAGLLADMGVTEELVAREVAEALRPAARRALADGYLESRVRGRLEGFYSSLGT